MVIANIGYSADLDYVYRECFPRGRAAFVARKP